MLSDRVGRGGARTSQSIPGRPTRPFMYLEIAQVVVAPLLLVQALDHAHGLVEDGAEVDAVVARATVHEFVHPLDHRLLRCRCVWLALGSGFMEGGRAAVANRSAYGPWRR